MRLWVKPRDGADRIDVGLGVGPTTALARVRGIASSLATNGFKLVLIDTVIEFTHGLCSGAFAHLLIMVLKTLEPAHPFLVSVGYY